MSRLPGRVEVSASEAPLTRRLGRERRDDGSEGVSTARAPGSAVLKDVCLEMES